MIYCEPKTDKALLAELDGSKKVLLLGCSLCSNISYCIHNQMKTPMFQGLDVAVNTKREAKRLKQLMSEKGIQSDSMTLIALCCISTKDVKKVIRKSKGFDTIATLSCEFGRRNTEEYAEGKRLVGTMRNKGLMRAIVDKKGLTISFVKDTLYINDKKYSR
jgi:hypothetical protein